MTERNISAEAYGATPKKPNPPLDGTWDRSPAEPPTPRNGGPRPPRQERRGRTGRKTADRHGDGRDGPPYSMRSPRRGEGHPGNEGSTSQSRVNGPRVSRFDRREGPLEGPIPSPLREHPVRTTPEDTDVNPVPLHGRWSQSLGGRGHDRIPGRHKSQQRSRTPSPVTRAVHQKQ